MEEPLASWKAATANPALAMEQAGWIYDMDPSEDPLLQAPVADFWLVALSWCMLAWLLWLGLRVMHALELTLHRVQPRGRLLVRERRRAQRRLHRRVFLAQRGER